LQAQYSSGWEGPLKQKSHKNTSYQHLPRRASPQERSVVLSAELCFRGCLVDEISIDQPYHVCLFNVYLCNSQPVLIIALSLQCCCGDFI